VVLPLPGNPDTTTNRLPFVSSICWLRLPTAAFGTHRGRWSSAPGCDRGRGPS
jgi:hypothetical protein